MDVRFILWLLSLGVSVGVAATLTYQWFAHRPWWQSHNTCDQSPCPHGGEHFCPGGTRRIITIDYLAALLVLGDELKAWADRTNQRFPLFKTRADIARKVVDAALGKQ